MTILISLLALVATFYQLHLQRVHNEKSLQPLGQIDFLAREKQISVYIQNNGVGPLIVNRVTFMKEGISYNSIRDCLSLDPKSYFSIDVTDSAKKVVLAGAFLEVFSTHFEDHEGKLEQDKVKQELVPLTLKADCKDIYGNKIVIERDFQWFKR